MATVRGDSANPNEAAVLGISTAPDAALAIHGRAARGAGVVGESVDWIGVYGESAKFEGVRGTSKNKDHAGVVALNDGGGAALYASGAVAVQASATTWIGVYGETQAPLGSGACAILGDGKDGGDGVKGHANGAGKAAIAGIHLSERGPGIYGEGAPAGRFKGDVEISGALSVGGVGFAALVARLAALQGQVAALTQRVAVLEGGAVRTSSAGTPRISVRQVSGTRRIEVDGVGFRRSAQYSIRLVVGSVGSEMRFSGATTAAGALSHVLPTENVPTGTAVWISATDGTPDARDLTGVRWSNTIQWTAS